ncbi:MAG: class I SAM-dependent RNA methyltransferase [Alphaproteobacteria bacterium]|nr:class I SAM-dependent RNA methyltransferase [Alphaproteobacteria bacterium]
MSVGLRIVEVGAHGDGVALEEGRRSFVPFALPGELVRPGPKLEILEPSSERQVPACGHFGTCGGCTLQHWRPEPYAAWKRGLIETALRRAGVEPPAFDPILIAGPGERRRADFALERHGRRAIAGFHERGSHRVVDVTACPVVDPAIQRALAALREVVPALIADGARLDAAVNLTDTGLDVLLKPRKPATLSLEQRQRAVALAEAGDVARLSWRERRAAEPLAVRRVPRLVWGDVTVEPPPGAFLQATRGAEAAMRAAIAAWLGDAEPLADLFAGVGALSLGRPGRVHLFESDPDAIAAVAAAGRRLGGGRVVAQHRDLFRVPLQAAELRPFAALLLDPPRAGAAAQAAGFAAAGPPLVVYASCDPASFARDAATLVAGGYRLERLRPIDQFLWSAHVELIALFRRPSVRSRGVSGGKKT